MKYIASLFLVTLISFSVYGQTNLQYNLKKGDVFLVKQTAKQTITQSLEGAEHVLNNSIEGLLEFTVLEQIEENYNVQLVFKDLNLNITSSIQGTVMDVKAKEVNESDMQSKIFNSLLDSPVQMVLAKNGDILEVQGGDSLVTKMSNASGIDDEFSKNMMKKGLEKEFGSEALSNSYKQMTFIYPNKKVKIEDTWTNEYTGKLQANNTWTFLGQDDTKTELSGTADVIMDVTDPNTIMKLLGKQETMVKADATSGFILNMEVESSLAGTSVITMMGDQEIPTTILSTTTYELIKE